MRLIGVGYQTVHDREFTMSRPHGYGEYLLLVMKTKAFHVVEGKRVVVPENTVILYDKTTPQYYGAVGESYVDDWVHFSMTEEESTMVREKGIPFNTLIEAGDGERISSLIQNMSFEFYSANQNREDSSTLYVRLILNKLSECLQEGGRDTTSSLSNQLVELRLDFYNRPAAEWKVEEMAKRLNLSASYFQHSYKNLFGVSVMNDVITSRIAHSKILLSGTDFSIKKIAELCGYEYDVYFMRQFKKRTGMTAREYRKMKCGQLL